MCSSFAELRAGCRNKVSVFVGRNKVTARPQHHGREEIGYGTGTWRTGGRGWDRDGAGREGADKGKGRSTVSCSQCGNQGHDTSRCWIIHPTKLLEQGANNWNMTSRTQA